MPVPGSEFYFYHNLPWMAWNASLALLPFLLALLLFKNKIKINLFWIIGFFIYLVFLPNAPYILTDVVHLYTASLKTHSDKILFITVWQYLLFLLIGCYLFGDAYARFEHFVIKRFKFFMRPVRLIIFLLMSIGVYLGRFSRLNSWQVFSDPMSVLEGIIKLVSLHAVVYVSLFTILLYLIYFLFEKLHQHTHPHLHTHKK